MDVKYKKIHSYIVQNTLNIEDVMKDFSNYIYTIARNSYYELQNEDIEEIVIDVIFTVWKNQEKLDFNKKMSSYIAGITKNLIKKKYRNIKIIDNIDDYEEKLIDFSNIELQYTEKEENSNIMMQLELLKSEDKNVFMKYYYEEKSIKEISKLSNMSESKIKSKLFRVRNKLKKFIKERGYNSNDK